MLDRAARNARKRRRKTCDKKAGPGRPLIPPEEVEARSAEASDVEPLLAGFKALHKLARWTKDPAVVEAEGRRFVRVFVESPPRAGARAKNHPAVYLLPFGFTDETSDIPRLLSWAVAEYRERQERPVDKGRKRPPRYWASLVVATLRNEPDYDGYRWDTPFPSLTFRKKTPRALTWTTAAPHRLADIDKATRTTRATRRLLSRRASRESGEND